MSDREKRLLYLLIGAAFVVVNLGVYKKVYETRLGAAESKLLGAQAKLEAAQTLIDTRDVYEAEMKWLEAREPKQATTQQQAQTRLQQLVQTYAKTQGLETKETRLQTSITDPSLNYHRVRIQVTVSGTEQQLYPFLARLHSPNDFRAVTYMRVGPQKNAPTRADCQVMVEQWFVPDDGTQSPTS